jgi:two-component system, OmpR family, heavy metal sensor histidine kinase CusS
MIRLMSIRLRLTLWYGVILSVILVGFSASVYVLMRHHLLVLLDSGLAEELTELGDDVGQVYSPSGLGPRYAQHEDYDHQVATPDGRILFYGDRLGPEKLPFDRSKLSPHGTRSSTLVVGAIGRLRLATRLISGPHGPLVIQAATSLGPFDQALRELLAVLLLTGTSAVACSLGVGYLLARKALAPVDRMVSAAEEITATRLDRRLEITCADDELGRLGRTLNDMIERLERSFSRIRQFTADAAHELRTPLAVIRSSAEVALREPRSPEQDRQVLEEIVEESERLGRIVAQLLDLCREDHGLVTESQRVIWLDSLAREVAELMQIAAQEKGVRLSAADLSPGCVRGDADRLRQLLINVLDNAIKYTPSDGLVTVKSTSASGRVLIEVTDTGAGIPAEHLQNVFERFYRVDASRSGGIDGTGLGLALCRSIAEAHRGRIWIESEPGRGTKVSLELPCGPGDSDERSIDETNVDRGAGAISRPVPIDGDSPVSRESGHSTAGLVIRT